MLANKISEWGAHDGGSCLICILMRIRTVMIMIVIMMMVMIVMMMRMMMMMITASKCAGAMFLCLASCVTAR